MDYCVTHPMDYELVWNQMNKVWEAQKKAPPEREPMEEENEIVARVRAIKYATKYLENSDRFVAIKIFDPNNSSKLGIRIDKREEIFSKKTFLVLSRFKYRNDNMGNGWVPDRQNRVIGITKNGGYIPLVGWRGIELDSLKKK